MAGTIRAVLGLTSLVLIAGSIVLIIFVVLGGVKTTSPLNKTYFLTADTSSISEARGTSQWNFFYVCDAGNTNCGNAVPALPFGYAWVGGGNGAPSDLLGSHGKNTTSTFYYYVWRFGWVFYLMGLVLDVVGFFTALLAPFSRLASAFSGLIVSGALVFFGLGAALMTAEFVKARDHFRNNGMSASIGHYAFGFTWAAWFALLIASFLLFCGCAFGRSRNDGAVTSSRSAGAGRFFTSRRSRRSTRGSFVNGGESESQQRVKDEY